MHGVDAFVSMDDGLRLFTTSAGEGPSTLVVPNGAYFVDDFAFLWPGRRVVVYDLRNRGRSDALSSTSRPPRGIEDDIDDLEALRRHLASSASICSVTRTLCCWSPSMRCGIRSARPGW